MARTKTVEIEGRIFPFGVDHLGTAVIANIRVPIIRGTAKLIPQLKGVEGRYCYAKNVVYIEAGKSPTEERDVIVHELSHAFIYLTGIQEAFKVMTGIRGKKLTRMLEAFVRLATPHLVPFWKDTRLE